MIFFFFECDSFLFDVHADGEELFFDSKACLDSDCEDDFFSVNGGICHSPCVFSPDAATCCDHY